MSFPRNKAWHVVQAKTTFSINKQYCHHSRDHVKLTVHVNNSLFGKETVDT